ncbi:histidine kinase [Jejuia pallidilutea]|uniref:Sensor histidine kinase n=1 Tax=Jejuia pallidilutea TaxID=504487 RepID=A0A090WEQ4_9FLAO|nr:histidine kinase [Jejuia pallidilutea]GAL65987.1 sensor histidine kinase [Jejuia pallidilutea]GAL70618.1 sensor histidine kinase [Jejuia pallidilutea]GAL88049.1 sensor histidine kinase [Jejuia pallidilutea]
MNFYFKYLLFFYVAFGSLTAVAQVNMLNDSPRFTVRGSVLEQDTRNPIPNVNIQINGGSYTTTDMFGEFRVEARKGDELTIRHKDFETIYYTILSNERITVEVAPNTQNKTFSKRSKKVRQPQFNWFIDSAEVYLKKDAKKSIQFIADALELSNSKKETGDAYEVLGDIYMYWKQYDLAVSNYQISLQNKGVNETRLKLANAYRLNENYQESIQEYSTINKTELSNYQLVTIYEGLGDVYKNINQYDNAIKAYRDGLLEAQNHLIIPKITDLNSKIAEVLSSKGEVAEAQGYYNKSLKLADNQNIKRAVQERVKVADFQNTVNNFTDEIVLRKQALEDINNIETEKDSIIDNESALTSQKQKYKIGNAYAQQNDFSNAINYLEESKEEAETKEDLIVQKDATRRLSEVYKTTGDFTKALAAYQEYVDVVDKLYRKKEQEISQATRFRKDLSTKQNRITSLESDRELSESKYQLTVEQSKRQKIIIYSLIGGLFLLLLTAFLMYKYIRQQRLANNLLALKSLRSQMNPHFIFNALNSVNSFIASNDERTANKYLTDFSKLMRAVLENSEEDFIPLENEIELLQLYTQLEHFRFQDKFDYAIHVDEKINIKDFVIPPMLLQPYIENAVWHGLRYKKEKGHLNINISQEYKDEIKITIADDGIGRKKSKALKTKNQKKQNSKGMGNIKKRVAILNDMYKDKVNVFIDDFKDEEDTGTKVVVTLKKD